jgi:hypothetical protein
MRVSTHADERALQRTFQNPESIIELIENKAVVSLGFDDEFEYLLFHSHPDHDEKIAVVRRDWKKLVSVWHVYFKLPCGIRPPTGKRKRLARSLFRSYLFRQRVHAPSPKIEEPNDRRTYIEITCNHTVEFKYECGNVVIRQNTPLEKMIEMMRERLEFVVGIVNENRSRIKGKVRFRVVCTDPLGGQPFVSNAIEHKTLVRRLAAAPP